VRAGAARVRGGSADREDGCSDVGVFGCSDVRSSGVRMLGIRMERMERKLIWNMEMMG
jgi:hypothetical protein